MTPFLIFDAYGTLVELDDFYGRLQRGFEKSGVTLPVDVVKKAARREMHHYMSNSLRAHQQNEWHALRRECAQLLADAVRAQDYSLALSTDEVLSILADAIVFHAFPETREVLQELQRREIPMGVLSNWDYQLPDVLRSLELDTFFQFIVPSTEAGVEKPAPAFFSCGLQRVREIRPDVETRHCCYIGDHYEKDVLPARAAGMTPLWLVRDERDVASGQVHEAHDDVRRLRMLKDIYRVLDEHSA
jgi:HAD superfamily hydrolase (TIGR01549 family)